MNKPIQRPPTASSSQDVAASLARRFAMSGTTRSFASDEKGTVAIMFALTTLVVMSLVGGAVDYGRAVTARDQIQNAVDASVLAAARVWQTENDMNLAQAKGMQYYDFNKPTNVVSAVSGFTPDLVRNSIVMEASATVPTPFLSMVRQDGYEIYARAEAILAVGGNAEQNLEISLMLDATGSMSGTKAQDLKDAAKDLIDIVVWDDQSEYTSRVALAPFASHVNVGNLVSQFTGYNPTSGSKKLIECVSDRTGVDQHSDEPPGPGSYLGPYKPGSGNGNTKTSDQYSSSGNCSTPSAEIMPLTNNKQNLKNRIDQVGASGATAGALGTAWAWYLLSPKWGDYWPASRPVAYNTPKTQKIAVLMTDGVYNRYKAQSWNSSSVSAFAKTICRKMKDETVIVYTIGFKLNNNSTAIDTLRDCASDESKFYEANDGDALRQAFRDIALQIAKLRLSQ